MSISKRLKEEAVKKKLKTPEVAMESTPAQEASVEAGTASAPYADPDKELAYQKGLNPDYVSTAPIEIDPLPMPPAPIEMSGEEVYYSPEHLAGLEDKLAPEQGQGFVDQNKDWMIAGATPLLMGLLMGNVGDAYEVTSKGILGLEKRKHDEAMKEKSFARKLALASAQKKDSGLVKIKGEDGKGKYVTRAEAIGKEPYDKASDFHLDEKMQLETHKAGLKKLEGELKSGDLSKDQFDRKLKIHKTWDGNDTTRATRKMTSAFAKIKSALNSPAGNLGMIFSYMRMLDPASTVRESEYRSAAQAGELPDKVQNWYDTMVKRRKLTPTQRKDFERSSQRLYAAQLKQQKNVDADAIRFATEAGIPKPDTVVSQFGRGMGLEKEIPYTKEEIKKAADGTRLRLNGVLYEKQGNTLVKVSDE